MKNVNVSFQTGAWLLSFTVVCFRPSGADFMINFTYGSGVSTVNIRNTFCDTDRILMEQNLKSRL